MLPMLFTIDLVGSLDWPQVTLLVLFMATVASFVLRRVGLGVLLLLVTFVFFVALAPAFIPIGPGLPPGPDAQAELYVRSVIFYESDEWDTLTEVEWSYPEPEGFDGVIFRRHADRDVRFASFHFTNSSLARTSFEEYRGNLEGPIDVAKDANLKFLGIRGNNSREVFNRKLNERILHCRSGSDEIFVIVFDQNDSSFVERLFTPISKGDTGTGKVG